MLARTATLLEEVDKRIRALITLAYAVCADETPLRAGAATPRPGRKKAEKYLLVACTDLYTSYLVGDRDLDTFRTSVIAERDGAVLVHDRYRVYDSTKLGTFIHQLCCPHILRDLDGAAEVYPDAAWPTQIAQALRGLIHHANLARAAGAERIAPAVRDQLVDEFRHGVRVGLSDTTSRGDRPGETKARCLLEDLRDREADVSLRPRPARTAHLQPGRTRPAPRQDATEHLRPAYQRKTNRRPLPHPRLPVHRRQARSQCAARPARSHPRPPLDAARPSPGLTDNNARPATNSPGADHPCETPGQRRG